MARILINLLTQRNNVTESSLQYIHSNNARGIVGAGLVVRGVWRPEREYLSGLCRTLG